MLRLTRSWSWGDGVETRERGDDVESGDSDGSGVLVGDGQVRVLESSCSECAAVQV